jgi:hypothetical protein
MMDIGLYLVILITLLTIYTYIQSIHKTLNFRNIPLVSEVDETT